jgi:hypothetical protein
VLSRRLPKDAHFVAMSTGKAETISLDKWRKKWSDYTEPPDTHDQQREAAFLESHWRYGALAHQVAADALLEALRREQDTERQHALCLKLFAEQVNALETLGAWGWAIRHRHEFRLFLDGFLSYPVGAADEFFCSVQEAESVDLISLLALLPRHTIIRAVRDLHPEFTSRDVGEMLDFVAPQLRECADLYLRDERVLVTHYNKAKHGATMVRLAQHTRASTDFQIIAPQRVVAEIENGRWYHVAKMTTSDELIQPIVHNITQVTNLIRNLSVITQAMHSAGILYAASPDRRYGRDR